jgi:hypothetical protein
MKIREATAAAAGLVLMASVGLTGAGAASAASPALKSGSQWTLEENGSGCAVDTFAWPDTWTDDHGDSGTWSVSTSTNGKKNIIMYSSDGTFGGQLTKTPMREYAGYFEINDMIYTGQLVKGVIPTFNGHTC